MTTGETRAPDWHDWPPPAPGTYAVRNQLRTVGEPCPDYIRILSAVELTEPLHDGTFYKAQCRYYGPIPNDPVNKKPPRRRKAKG